MRRAILAACMLTLTAGCGAAGSATPAGSGSNAQPVQAPVAAPGQPAQAPAQKAPGLRVAPTRWASPVPAEQRPVIQTSAAPGDGTQPCPADAGPPVHKVCPGA